MEFVYVGNDNIVTLSELGSTSVGSEGYTNTASVVMTVVESGNTSGIGGQSWPIDFTLVSSETGTWQAPITDTASLQEGEYYQANITADAGAGFRGEWSLPIKAIVREKE